MNDPVLHNNVHPPGVIELGCEFGESACLIHGVPYQVSIPEAAIYSIEPNMLIFQLQGGSSSIGSIVPDENGNILAATSRGIYRISRHGEFVENLGLPPQYADRFESLDDTERMRFNDMKVGPDGKIYVGLIFDDSLARKNNPGEAVLLSFDGSRWVKEIDRLTTPNGGVWIENEGTIFFYLNDTPLRVIKEYTINDGVYQFSRNIDLSHLEGRPDGTTLAKLTPLGFENESTVLVIAMYAGGQLAVVDPFKDEVVELIRIPGSKHPTSVILDETYAYVTSGRVENDSGFTFRINLKDYGLSQLRIPSAKI